MRLTACLALTASLLWAADTPARLFEKAAAALAAGDYAAAEQGFQQVLQTSPNHVGALGNLGVIYSRTERPDSAIATYQRALRVSPNDKSLLLNLGLVYLKQDSHADALPVFRRLASVDPQSLQARELLATCELYTGQASQAVRSLEALRKQDAGNPGLLYLLGVGYFKSNQPEKAQRVLDQFLASVPPARANLVLCKAHYESGRFEEAVDHCRKTIGIDPNFDGAHRELGKALVSLRSPDAASELEAAIRQNANDAEALYFLGGVLMQEDRPADATPYLERARQLNPGFWGNYFYLGKAKMQSNQPAEAIPLLEKAAELNSREGAVFYQLGRALMAVGKTEQANRAMRKVRELREQ